MLKQAIFLDRDGVINQNRSDYVKSWTEYVFLPDVFSSLKRVANSNYLIVIISNQSPIGRGIIQKEVVDEINARMQAEIERCDGRVDAIYYCPHAPEDNCECRKPRPGMFFRAAQELDIDLANSYFIGDALSDVQAAFNAGCRPIMVLTGRGAEQSMQLNNLRPGEIVPVAQDLAAALDFIPDI
jgi:histidinol-phosphate phosphatase family protein